MAKLMNIIYVVVRVSGEDKMCWKPAKRRGFEVSVYYRVLTCADDHSFAWKSIRKPKIPSRATFFVFELQPWGIF